MSLILSLGSNQGDRLRNLKNASESLCREFDYQYSSSIYESRAVDNINQENFYNQLMEFSLPKIEPLVALNKVMEIEKNLGRVRDSRVYKGPRVIDIDIIFWGLSEIKMPSLVIPHERWFQREFILYPLSELPFYQKLNSDVRFSPYLNIREISLKKIL